MFREIREIKKEEKKLGKNYTQIKPKTEITKEEADEFWKQMFEKLSKEA